MTQLTAALARLRALGRLPGIVREVRSAPPGDPEGIADLARVYRASGLAPTVFPEVADALEEYAAVLAAAQAEHAGMRAAFRGVPLFMRLGALARLARGCVQAHTAASGAADLAARRFGDLGGRARIAAGVGAGLPVEQAAALATAAAAGYDSGVLGPRLRLAGPRLTEHAALIERAGSDLERAWLIKALAVGEPGLAEFADAIRGKPAAWLSEHLTLVDRHGPVAQTRLGAAVRQYEPNTCGTTCLIVARAEYDPATRSPSPPATSPRSSPPPARPSTARPTAGTRAPSAPHRAAWPPG
ncbi:hypothetical protein ACFQV2_08300 [Actinokineospora soli]|uniref:DUF222 domain-containing protein n=1 Tax=Actinokineospora soli TaxID=1048753 RepID=A0ABW2TKF3_9PSEU